MILTEQGENFLQNINLYKDYNLHTMVNITGVEILKNNTILPVSTIYLESDDGDILFIADYCTQKEAEELILKISESLEIKNLHQLTISENPNKENNQEMIKYIAYADPDIRPVLFAGETTINNNKISISDNCILLNGESETPQDFLLKLFTPDNSPEKKILLMNEIDKKKNNLLSIIEQLTLLFDTLNKENVCPKFFEIDGKIIEGLVFKDEVGKYKAISINQKTNIFNKFQIKGDSSWESIMKNINKDYETHNEKIIEGRDLHD